MDLLIGFGRPFQAASWLAVMLAVYGSHGSPLRSADGAPLFREQSDVLLITAGGPVVIRIHCRLEEVAVVAAQQELAGKLLPLMDENRDGALSPDEAARAPAYGRFGQQKRLGEQWSEIDDAPRDGSVSVDELAAHIGASTKVRLQLTAGSSARAQVLDLRQRLDANGDGLITTDELRGGAAALHQCDFDNDGTYSLVELEALSQASADAPEGRTPLSALLPFVPVGAVSVESAATLFATSQTLSASDESDRRRPDRDGDGEITAAELHDYLTALEPDYVLYVSFDGAGNARLEWGVARPDGTPSELLRSRRRTEALVVQAGGLELKLSWQKADVVTPILRELLETQFGVADRNGNKYIEAAEFPGLDLPGREFDDVDFDANGEITRDEFDLFVEQDRYFSQFELAATVENEHKSLFQQLDTDQDRRLSPRELRGNLDEAGAVAPNLVGETAKADTGPTLIFAQRVPRLSSQQIKSDRRPGRSTAGRQPVITATTEGPLWFRRMDRNQDGDVSWAEFLGPREAFEEMDGDGDGLIDAAEASRGPS